MASIGTAYVDIKGDYSGLTKSARRGISPAAKIAGAAMAAGIGVALKGAISEARESIKVGKDTAAVIKSTGKAANLSKTQIESLSEALSAKAGIDDEVIQTGANLLLTFTKVRDEQGKGNKVFSEGLALATDLSARFKKDLNSSIIMVGKALNDPVKGINAMSRAGVQFTQTEKDKIKALVESGKTMEAQKIILGTLSEQVKGAAEANADPFDRFRVAIDNLKEDIGLVLLPAMTSAATAVSDFIENTKSGKGFGAGIVRSAKKVFTKVKEIFSAGVGGFNDGGETLGGLLPDTRSFVEKMSDAISAGISEAFGNIDTAEAADTLLQVILKAVNLAMDPAFWKEHWKEIALLIPIGKLFKIPGLSKLFDILWPWVKRAFMFLGRAGGRMLAGVAKQMADEFLKVLGKLPVWVGVLLVSVVNRIRSYATRFFGGGRGLGARLLDGFESLGRLFVKVGAWLIQKAWDGIKSLGGLLGRAGKWAAGKVRDGLAALWKLFYRAGGFLVDKFVDGIKAAPGKLKNIGKWIGNQVQSGIGKIKAAVGIGGTVGPMAFGKDGGGLGAVTSLAAKMGMSVSSGYRPGDKGWHGKNRARDYVGGNMAGFAKAVAGKFGSRLLELIYSPLGWGIKNGKKVGNGFWGADVVADHYDHVHVAMRRGGKAGPGSGGPSVVYGEGKKDEWWISQEGDRKKNTAWALEALSAVSGNRLAMFKKGGKKKRMTAAQKAARSVRIFNSKMDREDALDAAYDDPKFDVNLGKRLAKVDKLLKNKRLSRDDRNALLNLRGQIIDAMRPEEDTTSTEPADSGLTDAIRDLNTTMQENKKFAESVHTAHKSVTDTTLDNILDRSLGGTLSQMLLTLGPRMAT